MIEQDEWLRKLCGSAAFSWERDPDLYVRTHEEESARERSFGKWIATAAGGEATLFENFLDWNGWSKEEAALRIGSAVLRSNAPVPNWARTLTAVLDKASQRQLLEGTVNEPELPFAPIWAWLSEAAFDLLIEETPVSVPPSVAIDLKRALEHSLSQAGAAILYADFNAERATIRSLAGIGDEAGIYNRKLLEWRQTSLQNVLNKFPLFGRQAGTLIENWKSAAIELLVRLKNDRELIAEKFRIPEATELKHVILGLSDRHREGRGVVILSFANGEDLVYKPKSLKTEVIYADLLNLVTRESGETGTCQPEVLDRGSYGWVEYFVHGPCDDDAAIARFYERLGAHLALCYVMGATDMHHENVLAVGDNPVLIDLETLVHGRVHYDPEGTFGANVAATNAFFFESVIRTGLLPRWDFDSAGRAFDLSGIGGGLEGFVVNTQTWKHLNTDLMRSMSTKVDTPAPKNRPYYRDGNLADPLKFEGALLKGFSAAYLAVANNRDVFKPVIAKLAEAPSRYIFRNTRVYGSIISSWGQAKMQSSAVSASMAVDALSRALLLDFEHEDSKHPLFSVFLQERTAMARLDVPVFETLGDRTELIMENGDAIAGALNEPPMERTWVRLEQLGTDDLERQKSYIRASFAAVAPQHKVIEEVEVERLENGGPDLWRKAVENLAEGIEKSAYVAEDGKSRGAWWLAITYFDRAQRWQMGPMLARLYDGIAGTGIFLAAMSRATGSEVCGRLALDVLNQCEESMYNLESTRAAFSNGIGVGTGAFSLLYAITLMRDMLDLPYNNDVHDAFLHQLTPERISQDRRLDVLGGSAGAILAIVASERREEEKLSLLANHLMDSRVSSANGMRVWPGSGRFPLAGFAHGACGIAHALLKAAETLGESRFADAALEGLAYEEDIFDEERGGWPDYRYPPLSGRDIISDSWCGGTAGIGLMRLANRELEGSERDLTRVMARLKSAKYSSLDHVCCGESGKVLFLHELSKHGLCDRADFDGMLDRLAQQALSQEGVSLGWDVDVSNPAFFQGTAGVGYTLLKAAYPQTELPKIELFER